MDFGFGQVHATAATDIGLRRAVNEDAVLEAGTLFAVADGMGGHEAGDLASRLGIATLNELAEADPGTASQPPLLPHARDVLAQVAAADARIRQAIGARGGTTLCALALVRTEAEGGSWPGEGDRDPQTARLSSAGPPPAAGAVRPPMPALGEPRYLAGTEEALEAENEVAPAGEPTGQPAGTPAQDPAPTTDVLPRAELEAAIAGAPQAPTVAATSPKVTAIPGAAAPGQQARPEEIRLMLLNVGDSRGYRLRDGVLAQLTRDHSAVQELIDAGIITEAEARIHPQRNLITRALGAGGNAVPDTQFHTPRPGDRYLLCTDGLTGEVEAEAIEHILAHVPDRAEAVGRLIDAALSSGGRDNISVLIVDIEAPHG